MQTSVGTIVTVHDSGATIITHVTRGYSGGEYEQTHYWYKDCDCTEGYCSSQGSHYGMRAYPEQCEQCLARHDAWCIAHNLVRYTLSGHHAFTYDVQVRVGNTWRPFSLLSPCEVAVMDGLKTMHLMTEEQVPELHTWWGSTAEIVKKDRYVPVYTPLPHEGAKCLRQVTRQRKSPIAVWMEEVDLEGVGIRTMNPYQDSPRITKSMYRTFTGKEDALAFIAGLMGPFFRFFWVGPKYPDYIPEYMGYHMRIYRELWSLEESDMCVIFGLSPDQYRMVQVQEVRAMRQIQAVADALQIEHLTLARFYSELIEKGL